MTRRCLSIISNIKALLDNSVRQLICPPIMKYILLLLWLPLFAPAQTVHIKDKKIDYQETVLVKNCSKTELFRRAQAALINHITTDEKNILPENKKSDAIAADGKMKLLADGGTTNELLYTMEIKVKNGSYQYHIHKVHLVQYKGGAKISDIASEDLLEGMDSSGEGATKTEKQLNEMDMDFQKLIALIKADMEDSK